jgi:hypothetical protein
MVILSVQGRQDLCIAEEVDSHHKIVADQEMNNRRELYSQPNPSRKASRREDYSGKSTLRPTQEFNSPTAILEASCGLEFMLESSCYMSRLLGGGRVLLLSLHGHVQSSARQRKRCPSIVYFPLPTSTPNSAQFHRAPGLHTQTLAYMFDSLLGPCFNTVPNS